MKILGVETSCDDTAIALIDASGDFDADFKFNTLAHAIHSQKEHEQYGGVFPNVARKEHEKHLVPLLAHVLQKSKLVCQGDALTEGIEKILEREQELLRQLLQFLKTHEKPGIDAIAVTVGPGLEPALWVGINFAKALAHAWNLPIVPVNHMEGHIVISALWDRNNEITNNQETSSKKIQLPMLSLLISGGHTELILSKKWMQYEYIGRTRDDAVGEAFDKVARMLGLPYPGGPAISKLAEAARNNVGIYEIPTLPRPMIYDKNFDFSFAGLKTAVLRKIEANTPVTEEFKKQLAREFEDAVTDVLVDKSMRAIENYSVKTLVIGGGVSANKHLRSQFREQCQGRTLTLLVPPPQFATDNALMIALAGYFRAKRNEFADPMTLSANGNLKLDEREEMPA